MSTPLWVTELAEAFWAEAGEAEPFPRHLRRPIALALPLHVVSLSRLCVAGVLGWLRARDIACRLDAPDRPLRGCLVARHGGGIAFVDGGDGEAEQRFSLAHELAHFLRDYWQPRRRAVETFGEGVLQVLDGLRPATPEERLHALLRRVPLGFHVHLMRRDGPVAAAERDADRLAFELLAPAPEVLATSGGPAAVRRRLCEEFGLPPAQVESYADLLCPRLPAADGFLAGLKRLL